MKKINQRPIAQLKGRRVKTVKESVGYFSICC